MAHRNHIARLLLGPVLAAVIIATPFAVASAVPTLPHKNATQVLASVAKASNLTGYTGMLTQTSNLGIPDISGSLTGGATGTTSAASDAATDTLTRTLSILSANQRARISVGNQGLRAQLYKTTGEQDLIINRGNLWTWDYEAQAVTHTKLPTLSTDAAKRLNAALTLASPQAPLITPQQLAESIINGLDPHTRVSLGRNQYVAGQAAYTLVFTPRETNTLVGNVQLMVDAKTGLVLQVSVHARSGNTLAYQVGFTALGYGNPPAHTFTFTPPPRTHVTTTDYSLPALQRQLVAATSPGNGTKQTELETSVTQALGIVGGAVAIVGTVQISGDGWARVVTLPAKTLDISNNKAARALTTPLSNGDRLISTTLLNVVISKNGAVKFGSVPVASLTATP